ncbi:MAG: L-aspartate oxidase, partial [Planctomycetes bacterium]|nr:L-aspartate oxidase [Planctomycetota bacterium]
NPKQGVGNSGGAGHAAAMIAPRYLLAFDTKTLPAESVDVLVVGAGVAGMACAIEAAKHGRGVLLVSKSSLSESNTAYAQGGIAAALQGIADGPELHLADTLATGEGLCDEAVVREVVSSGQSAIDFLIDCGVKFDRDARGQLEIAMEAAHSEARVLHAGGDKTGREIARGMIARVNAEELIRSYEHCFVVDLLTSDECCVGALISYRGELRVIYASVVVLASGGCGRLYRESSNPKVATGDGHAMALRAGATMRDLELVQFHPTILYVAGGPRVLVTEAIRGAGAYLRNDLGERFMLKVDERGELAPRDVVSRAIEREMRARAEGSVFLDVTHLPLGEVRRRFPGFAEVCESRGLDLSKSWVPVRPGPHYMIGGVAVDHEARSTIDGLYAIGEAAASGLHGANRLASNSLLEGVVLGRRLGTHLAGLNLMAARALRVR